MAFNCDYEADDSVNFQTEISKMMYGFGDSPNPNPETVLLIDSIILQQLRSLLKEAYELSVKRGKKSITNYELIYLFYVNRNVLKLKRLHDFQVAQEAIEDIDDVVLLEELIDEDDVVEKDCSASRKKRTHIDIIQEIDAAGLVRNINYDYLGHLRKIRAKNVTDAMTPEQYESFQEARRSSFRTTESPRFSKLNEWINSKNEFNISNSALEVLSFIAYETVADIVDAVLLTRQNSSRSRGHNCISSTLQLNNGVSVQWAIGVMEVHEALTKYFTPRAWLNSLFYKDMGLGYLFSD